MKKRHVEYFVFLIVGAFAIYLIPQKLVSVWNNRANQSYDEGNLDEAVAVYQRALKLFPSAPGYYNLGCAYEKKGKIKKAIEAYEQAFEMKPDYAQACRALMELYKAQGDVEKALEYSRKLRDIPEDKPQESLDNRNAQKEKAVKMFNEAVGWYRQGNKPVALTRFQETIECDPGFVDAYRAAGDICFEQHEFRQAIGYYEKMIQLGGDDAVLYNNIGISYMRQRDYKSAVKFLRIAYGMAPEKADIAYNLAGTLRDNGAREEALSLYKKVEEKIPNYPNLHNDMAEIYENTGRFEMAQQEYEKEYDIVQSEIASGVVTEENLVRLAVAYIGREDPKKGKEILDEVIKKNPYSWNAYYARSFANERMANLPAACRDLDLAERFACNPLPLVAPEPQVQPPIDVPLRTVADSGPADFSADTVVYLKNGHVMKGRLKEETDTKIVLQLQAGDSVGTITFSKAKVKKIEKRN
ncbi:MAG: tetratricopeptide repeat protein [Candidatus Omnitrophica bacterium]|nr:tetratricopeptide repeat protein [Candidatus Omnitrophota bacterium]